MNNKILYYGVFCFSPINYKYRVIENECLDKSTFRSIQKRKHFQMKRFCKKVIFFFLRLVAGMKVTTKSKFSKIFQIMIFTVTLRAYLVSKVNKSNSVSLAIKMKIRIEIKVKMILIMITRVIITYKLIVLKIIKLN